MKTSQSIIQENSDDHLLRELVESEMREFGSILEEGEVEAAYHLERSSGEKRTKKHRAPKFRD